MVNHLIVGHGKQIAFATGKFNLISVHPHFFKGSLYDITAILFMPEVLQDEAIHVIRVQVYTLIILFLSHTVAGATGDFYLKAVLNT
jgi:hypothetical protein